MRATWVMIILLVMKSLIILVLLFTATTVSAAAPLIVRYPAPMQGESTYPLELMRLVLDASGAPYEMQPVFMESVSEERRLKFVGRGDEINVYWVAHLESVPGVTSVDIPLYKGLSYYRVLYGKKINDDKLTSVEDLHKKQIVQTIGMPDVRILKEMGMKVQTPHKPQHMLDMLSKGRADIVPIPVTQLSAFDGNYASHYEGVTMGVNTLLKYPCPMVFYVHQADQKLVKALHRGFMHIIDNGAYDRFFKTHPDIGYMMEKVQFKRRDCYEVGDHKIHTEHMMYRHKGDLSELISCEKSTL